MFPILFGRLVILLHPDGGGQVPLDGPQTSGDSYLSPLQASWYCILGCKAEGSYGKVRLNSNHLPSSGESVSPLLCCRPSHSRVNHTAAVRSPYEVITAVD